MHLLFHLCSSFFGSDQKMRLVFKTFVFNGDRSLSMEELTILICVCERAITLLSGVKVRACVLCVCVRARACVCACVPCARAVCFSRSWSLVLWVIYTTQDPPVDALEQVTKNAFETIGILQVCMYAYILAQYWVHPFPTSLGSIDPLGAHWLPLSFLFCSKERSQKTSSFTGQHMKKLWANFSSGCENLRASPHSVLVRDDYGCQAGDTEECRFCVSWKYS